MEVWMDSLKVIGRILTILPLLLFIGIYMGKRSIGELPVFDFLVVLVLGAVVGADIADPSIDHTHTVVAMVAIALLQKFIIYLKLKYRKFGNLVTFEPTIVVHQGELMTENIRKINYSLDNILQMLREKDVFQLKNVEIAIIEANGRLTMRLKPENTPVTIADMNLPAEEVDYEIPVILDGEIQRDVLTKLDKTPEWLRQQLHANHIKDEANVFYAGVTKKGDLNFTLKGQLKAGVPPIFH
ncbi:DUF421 domain-containing protein [Bacillus sp. B15-48]|uniref:DUF421 domain-containing protein n=1 Tax=Bacillus sp. B15-48 TaxID=1548601 RepID=UPI001EF39829|nr:DUF421 domain-containing protein [Bacillus sp. B15-48]MBM4760929.1 DUF421 domain-containing protein [Bacillus sp. B15-48]